MWQCPKCSEPLEDSFDSCWNCGTSFDGTEDPSFRKADDLPLEPSGNRINLEAQSSDSQQPDAASRAGAPGPRSIKCRDCGVASSYLGHVDFMKQSNSLLFGLLAAFTERDAANLVTFPIDVFRCPKCGRLELYDLNHSLPAP